MGSNQTVAGLKLFRWLLIIVVVDYGSNQTVAGLKPRFVPVGFFNVLSSNQTVAGLKRDIVKYKGKIIGGIMCPILNNRVIYEAYVAGEDRKYKKIYPSILATYAAMDYAVKNKIAKFDFMGAGRPDQDYGVREFKSKFGGKLVDFGRFEKIHKPSIFRFSKLGFKIWQKLK